jgi:hypothetical protein
MKASDPCVCGHPREDHYFYSLNGRDQGRCQGCDPFTDRRPGNYVMDSDSYVAGMDRTADHGFELVEVVG